MPRFTISYLLAIGMVLLTGWLAMASDDDKTIASGDAAAASVEGAAGQRARNAAEVTIDFDRDVRPILSNNCFFCHGPDEKEREKTGGFRLDRSESALGKAPRSGKFAIVPGDPAASELVRRIESRDPGEVMPPPDSHKTLTPAQIDTLKRWIAQGAPYAEHWAFVAPQRPDPPEVRRGDWAGNAIDRFVLARLEAEGLAPAAPADRRTLIRRVTLDLTGLPPTVAEVEAFVNDPSPDAYEKVVDRLLVSPRYGEHQARFWLDAVRYGDTHGLHLDNYREMWPYRDWVIEAFNRNQPYDQFIIEQLAGDLLEAPTLEQQIASGYNRCNVTTNEGGSIKEEVYVRNVVDRVNTASTVFLGLTLSCAQCHDHKYDPFTQKEYFQLFAFFNNLDGNAMDGNRKDHAPVVRVPTPELEAQLAKNQEQLAEAEQALRTEVEQVAYVEPAPSAEPAAPEPREIVWIDDAPPRGAKLQGNSPWKWVEKDKAPVHSGNRASTRSAGDEVSQHFFTGANPPLTVGEGDILFTHVYLDPNDPPKQIMLQWNDGSWEHRAYWGENVIPWGKNKTASRLYMGPLPEVGGWVRL